MRYCWNRLSWAEQNQILKMQNKRTAEVIKNKQIPNNLEYSNVSMVERTCINIIVETNQNHYHQMHTVVYVSL